MAAPAALTTVFPDRQGINDVLGEAGVKWRLDDDQTGVVSTAEESILTRLYSLGTAWVRLHVQNYDFSDYPATDNIGHQLVYWWACIWVAFHLAKRRGNPAMGSLQAMYDEAKEQLQAIQKGETTLADVAQIASPSMSVSNVRIDDSYPTRKLRVERPISDQVPARHTQNKDWVGEIVREPNP